MGSSSSQGSTGMVLRPETVNCTSFASLKNYLAVTKANLIMAQELWLLQHEVGEATQWALGQGWCMIASPSVPGHGRGKSAGVAILAREYLGLRHPDNGMWEVVPGRAICAVVCVPVIGQLHIYCMYLHHCVGLDAQNTGILKKVGEHAMEHGALLLAGADFNMEPSVMKDSEFPAMLDATIVCPEDGAYTCGSTGGHSIFDYMLMSDPLVRTLKEVEVVDTTLISTHAPFAATFHPLGVDLKILTFRALPRLPKEMPFGPATHPEDWSKAMQVAQKAVEVAAKAPMDKARAMFDMAYRHFANTCEREVAMRTGTDLKRYGLRGKIPEPQWVKPMDMGRRLDQTTLDAKSWKWLLEKAVEAEELGVACAHGTVTFGPLAGTVKDIDRRAVDLFVKACMRLTQAKPLGLGSSLDFDMAWDGLLKRLADALALIQQGGWHEAAAEQWAHAIGDIIASAKVLADSAANAERNHKAKTWAEWGDNALEKGARKMHKYTQVQLPWVPTTVMENGIVTADPQAILRAHVEELRPYWRVQDEEATPWVPDRRTLGLIPTDDILAAARSFPIDTSMSVDGFHGRHFGMLSQPGLVVLAMLMMLMEMLGVLPRQVNLLIVAMIPKGIGKAGKRPIVVFSTLYRLWAKCRYDAATRWLRGNDRPFFACGKGRSAEDVVWRQALKAEAATGKGSCAATALWDVRKFFENFSLELLRCRAIMAGFCPIILKVCINVFRGMRWVRLGKAYMPAGFAKDGLPAGCVFSCLFVAIYCLKAFDRVVKLCPQVDFDFYIDDLAFSAYGTGDQVTRRIADAGSYLLEAVEFDLKASVAEDKADVAASCPKLARRVYRALGPLGGRGKVHVAAVNLGIDHQPGAARGPGTKATKRIGRFAQAALRKKRIMQVRGRVPARKNRIAKIFTTGVKMSLGFGARVNGASCAELQRARRILMAATRPVVSGASLRAKIAVAGDPAADMALGPIMAWAAEVWRAATNATCPHLTLSELRAAWADTSEKEPHSWRKVDGPLGACRLSLDRIRWTVESPFLFVNDLGQKVPLTESSPKLVRRLLEESLKRSHERTLADHLGMRTEEGGRGALRAYVGAVQTAIKSKDFDALGKALVCSAACDGIWTRCRAADAGYLVDTTCELCGLDVDTVMHRLLECQAPEVVAARKEACPQWFLDRAGDGSSDPIKFTRGIIKHPADGLPLPTGDDGGCVFLGSDGSLIYQGDLNLGGFLFVDGSCTSHAIPELRRASWAIVELDRHGNTVAAVRGPVWAPLPQTPQSAEYCAMAAVPQLITRKAQVFGDCMGVVKVANLPRRSQLSHKLLYAGAFRACGSLPGASLVDDVSWVKAHVLDKMSQAEIQDMDPMDFWKAQGNSGADTHAKMALDCHQSYPDGAMEEVASSLKELKIIFRLMASVLRLWPKLPRGMGRVPTGARIPRARVEKPPTGHEWGLPQRGWTRCTRCWAALDIEGEADEAKRGPCPGRPPMLDQIGPGHRMFMHPCAGDNILMCHSCGTWGTRKLVILKGSCEGKAMLRRMPGRRRALDRVANDLHPSDCKRLKDVRLSGPPVPCPCAVQP